MSKNNSQYTHACIFALTNNVWFSGTFVQLFRAWTSAVLHRGKVGSELKSSGSSFLDEDSKIIRLISRMSSAWFSSLRKTIFWNSEIIISVIMNCMGLLKNISAVWSHLLRNSSRKMWNSSADTILKAWPNSGTTKFDTDRGSSAIPLEGVNGWISSSLKTSIKTVLALGSYFNFQTIWTKFSDMPGSNKAH